jgi:hypothetical protein
VTRVQQWVRDIVEEAYNAPKKVRSPSVGQRVRLVSVSPGGHKPSERRYPRGKHGWCEVDEIVKVINGQYWGEYGVSNFWYWRIVGKNGQLSKNTYCGYASFEKLNGMKE